jgi:NitT/TauT family transport system substrate-binding protein
MCRIVTILRSLQRAYRLAALAIGGTLALLPPARAEMEHATLALPADGMHFLALYAAQDFHFLEQQGLDLKIVFIAGIGSFNAVVSGAADFSVGSGASLARAAARGQRMLAIANMSSRPTWAVAVRKDIADAAHFDPQAPLATRAQVLKGLRMGIGGINTVAHAYLKVIARAGGVDPDNGMVVAAMQPPDIIAALSRKAIDGFVDGPPWPQKTVQDGTTVIIAEGIAGDPDWLAPIGSGVIITRPQTCTEHRSLCEKMGRGVAMGARFIHEHSPEAAESLKKRFPQVDAIALARSLTIVQMATPDPPLVEEAAIRNGDRVNVEAGLLAESDMLKSYKELFDNEFVR